MGWEVWPDGFHGLIMRITNDYNKPVIEITENGASYLDAPDAHGAVPDQRKVEYLRGYLSALGRSMKDGANVRAYHCWSLLDNFEWAKGYTQRFGIVYVHRLDKETSGVLLVAKNDFAHARLADSFRDRTIQKTYIALVQGLLGDDRGRIELPIARHPNHRTRMTADRAGLLPNSRPARTDWKVRARIDSTTLVEIQLHTGRTHQIRVHFSALRHPVVGDTLYGADDQLQVGHTTLPSLERNFLHAAKIVFTQPRLASPSR